MRNINVNFVWDLSQKMSLHGFLPKKPGLWLVEHIYRLANERSVFWRETTWTHVLTLWSQKKLTFRHKWKFTLVHVKVHHSHQVLDECNWNQWYCCKYTELHGHCKWHGWFQPNFLQSIFHMQLLPVDCQLLGKHPYAKWKFEILRLVLMSNGQKIFWFHIHILCSHYRHLNLEIY